MLILTRRVGETLMVGDDVTITVLGVKGIRCVLALTLLRMWRCIGKRFTSASRKNKIQNQATNLYPILAFQAGRTWVLCAPCCGEVAEWPKALPC